MISHVDEAVTEMFRAVHMQLLGTTCRLEKMLLAALVTETRATGKSLPTSLNYLSGASYMPEGPHTTGMQLLGNTCRLEKMLLAALVIETRATGKSAS